MNYDFPHNPSTPINPRSDYAILEFLTGVATAGFIAWKLTVKHAMVSATIGSRANTHQLILIRYAKSSSHLFIKYHATGDATSNDIRTSLRKSFDKSSTS